jgi:hypothetical protein
VVEVPLREDWRYVWAYSFECSQDPKEGNFPNSAPQGMMKATHGTRKLQHHYPWVDRYCIPQDYESEKDAQIQLMGFIYQNVLALPFSSVQALNQNLGMHPGTHVCYLQKQSVVRVGHSFLCSILSDTTTTYWLSHIKKLTMDIMRGVISKVNAINITSQFQRRPYLFRMREHIFAYHVIHSSQKVNTELW